MRSALHQIRSDT